MNAFNLKRTNLPFVVRCVICRAFHSVSANYKKMVNLEFFYFLKQEHNLIYTNLVYI